MNGSASDVIIFPFCKVSFHLALLLGMEKDHDFAVIFVVVNYMQKLAAAFESVCFSVCGSVCTCVCLISFLRSDDRIQDK